VDHRDTFSIDGWRIEADSHRMIRDGVEKKLEPRGLELLLYLAERPNQVVTRQEIEDDVWQGRVVGYDALSGSIAKLRKAFSDTSKNPRVIETIPKSGYRLIAQVLVVSDEKEMPSREPVGENFERKLAAIFYADVAGYSRLTGEDEDRTHHQLRQNMKIISELIVNYHGRIVHYAGDAVLADFATASTALHCALAVQQKIAEINSHLPENQQVLFRIGVNLGEVIIDGEEIYGDGVNVAARLESLAAPGGVCISGAVFDAIGQKQNFDFEYQGEKSVKNISRPVRAYAVHLKSGTAPPVPESPRNDTRPRAVASKVPVLWLGIGVIALVLVAVLYLLVQGSGQETTSTPQTPKHIVDEKTPSLAILPFRNISNNPGQDVYSAGLTDDLITDLYNTDGLRVIPRHSSSIYTDTELPISKIAEALQVRYIVQGSVRRSFGDIRVNVQLVDAATDQQVWAQRFDDKVENLFKLQDQLVAGILAGLNLKINVRAPSQRRTTNLEAYDYFLRAEHRRLNNRLETRSEETLVLYQKAIALDPEFVAAHIGLAREALENWQLDASQVMPAAASRKLVYQAAGKALELDPENPEALAILGLIQTISGAHDAGIASVRQAVALDPATPELHVDLAVVLSYYGLHEEALESIMTAIDLHVTPPAQYFRNRADIYFFLHQFDKALEDLNRPGVDPGTERVSEMRILVHGALGDREKAIPLVAAMLKQVAWFNLEYYRINYAYYRRAEDIELILDSFAKAGMPRFAYGFDPGNNPPLDDAGILALVEKKLWRGATHNRGEFFQQFHGSDGVAIRTPDTMMSGNYYINAGKLCVTFQSVLLDLPDCGYIYPDGDPGHYTWVTLGEVYSFTADG